MNISQIDLLGIGAEGADIVSELAGRFAFATSAYMDFSPQEKNDEYFIAFPGSKRYLYAEKHELYKVEDVDKIALSEILDQLDKHTIMAFNIAEPISQYLIPYIIDKSYQLVVRLPFKFENSDTYLASCAWAKKLRSRSRTSIVDSDLFSTLIKPVGLSGVYHQMLTGQANYIASLLKLIPSTAETRRLPLSYLCRDRITLIFDPDHLDAGPVEINKYIDQHLSLLQNDALSHVKISLFANQAGCLHFVSRSSALSTLALLQILLIYKEEIGSMATVAIWGKDTFEFQDILNPPVEAESTSYLPALQQLYLYLAQRLEHDGLRQAIQTKLMRLMNEYIIETDVQYHQYEFMQALQINNWLNENQ